MPSDTGTGSYVYVVCSSSDDHFAEIAAISIASLRIALPHARITVLADRQTSTLACPGLVALRPAIDDFTVVDCPGDTALARSRFLKANMRRLLTGRFIYLDCDTIIMKSPEAIWQIDCDVAACPDLSSNGKPYLASGALIETQAKLGWKFGSQTYLNAGVIYFSDTEASHAVGEQFHRSWLTFLQTVGKPNDQHAFNHALQVVEPRLAVLPGKYNAQIRMNALTLRGAAIVHFFTGDFDGDDETISHTTAKRLKRDGMLDLSMLSTAIASGNPWNKVDSYRKAVATRRYGSIARIALNRLTKKHSNPA